MDVRSVRPFHCGPVQGLRGSQSTHIESQENVCALPEAALASAVLTSQGWVAQCG